MKSKAGLWIDHRKAVIVIISDNEAHIKLVISKVEKQPGRSDGARSKTQYEQKQFEADDSRQREFTGHLNVYYDAVIACIRDAEAILIFGPGEAKGELKHRLEKNNLSGRIAVIETVDKMTDSQIMAKVRKHFLE
jgi:stalled ribosome rescue protein Dom34